MKINSQKTLLLLLIYSLESLKNIYISKYSIIETVECRFNLLSRVRSVINF